MPKVGKRAGKMVVLKEKPLVVVSAGKKVDELVVRMVDVKVALMDVVTVAERVVSTVETTDNLSAARTAAHWVVLLVDY